MELFHSNKCMSQSHWLSIPKLKFSTFSLLDAKNLAAKKSIIQ